MSFRLNTSETGREYHVRLVGEFDLAAFDDVNRELQRLQADARRRIVVDLHGLQFIDSSGLRALLLADERAKHRGTELVFTEPSAVRKVLRLTALDQHFTFAEEADRASA